MGDYFECKNGIYLEPRLQEYIKKKIYYKKNGINTGVPLEQEYDISQEDLRRLKAFKSGDKDIYSYKKQNQFLDKFQKPKFDFDPDQVYKSDIRYHRFAKKLKRDKDAMQQRHNYDNLDNDYENAFNPITKLGENNKHHIDDNQRDGNPNNWHLRDSHLYAPRDVNLLDARDFNLEINKKQMQGFNNKYKSDPYAQSKRVYSMNGSPENGYPKYTPQTDFAQTQYNNNYNPRLQEIIGNLDSYGNQIKPQYQHMAEMDKDFKVVIPNAMCNDKKSYNSSSYRPVPYIGRAEGIRDIDIECKLRNAPITKTSKSYGYRNPAEHYYDYISDDIQNPDHVVFDPAISTRLDNHKVAKPYRRDIY